MDGWSAPTLWAAVVASGLYHGLSPGMGWPLAVSAGLMDGGRPALLAALGWLAVGHLAAMAVVLLPVFALAALFLEYGREIRIVAGLLVFGAGLVLLLRRRRHPRALARIPPTRLALWSFAIATAHGAGLMLLPVFLGLCRTDGLDAGHRAADALIAGGVATAALVVVAHTAAMLAGSGAAALAVSEWLGLRAISRAWLNTDTLWAASLALVGALGVVAAAVAPMT